MQDEIILGLQHGDEGKGKVTLDRLKNGNFECCVRFNGGPNAGHTVYHNGVKHIIHQLPTGCVFGIKSLIGPGCVVDIDQVNKEVEELESHGIKVKENLFVSKNAHIIKDIHRELDAKNDKIGSTKRGIAYAYGDKYLRKGLRVENSILDYNLVDSYEFLKKINGPILFEGAQGFQLDIDFGEYPYVTSCSCGIAGVATTGISFDRIRNAKVTGVAKVYETYVGAKEFQGDDPVLKELQKVGQEFGATTGRKRQCNWLNLDSLIKTIKINGITEIIFNKVDIIQQIKSYKLIHENEIHTFKDWGTMKTYILHWFDANTIFSGSPYKI